MDPSFHLSRGDYPLTPLETQSAGFSAPSRASADAGLHLAPTTANFPIPVHPSSVGVTHALIRAGVEKTLWRYGVEKLHQLLSKPIGTLTRPTSTTLTLRGRPGKAVPIAVGDPWDLKMELGLLVVFDYAKDVQPSRSILRLCDEARIDSELINWQGSNSEFNAPHQAVPPEVEVDLKDLVTIHVGKKKCKKAVLLVEWPGLRIIRTFERLAEIAESPTLYNHDELRYTQLLTFAFVWTSRSFKRDDLDVAFEPEPWIEFFEANRDNFALSRVRQFMESFTPQAAEKLAMDTARWIYEKAMEGLNRKPEHERHGMEGLSTLRLAYWILLTWQCVHNSLVKGKIIHVGFVEDVHGAAWTLTPFEDCRENLSMLFYSPPSRLENAVRQEELPGPPSRNHGPLPTRPATIWAAEGRAGEGPVNPAHVPQRRLERFKNRIFASKKGKGAQHDERVID